MGDEGKCAACAILMLTMILSVGLVAQARAVTSTVNVAQNTVTINLRLELRENITESLGLGLPLINVNSLNQTDLMQAAANITRALRERVGPGVSAGVTMSAHSALLDNSTGMWLLQENYTIVVSGAVTTNGALTSVNLSLLSMNVSNPITVGSSQLNTVGGAYLLKPLDMLRTGHGTGYFIDGSQYTNTVVPDQVTSSFSLLDLSWVPPVEQWDRQDDLLKQSTTFNLGPSTPLAGGGVFNLTVGLFPVENVFLKKWIAVLDPSFQVVVPANAWAQGTTIYFDQPHIAELLMPVTVGVSLFVLVLALLFDRRLTRSASSFRRKKRS